MKAGTKLLIVWNGTAGLPARAFQRIQVRWPGGSKNLSSLSDLTGHVDIKSPEEAIAFVRLRTDESLAPIDMDWPLVQEVFTKRESIRHKRISSDSNYRDGFACTVSAGSNLKAAELVSQYPKVTNSKAGFFVSRIVVEEVRGKYTVSKLTEEVTRDGKWRIVSHDNSGLEPLKSIRWYIMREE